MVMQGDMLYCNDSVCAAIRLSSAHDFLLLSSVNHWNPCVCFIWATPVHLCHTMQESDYGVTLAIDNGAPMDSQVIRSGCGVHHSESKRKKILWRYTCNSHAA